MHAFMVFVLYMFSFSFWGIEGEGLDGWIAVVWWVGGEGSERASTYACTQADRQVADEVVR